MELLHKRTSFFAYVASLLLAFQLFTLVPAAAASGYACGNFFDVQSGTALCQAVSYVRDRAVFEGYATGDYSPQGNINRAEVLKVVLAAFLDEKFNTSYPPDGSEMGFSDLHPGEKAWWFVYLKRAKDIGFIKGYSDGSFRAINNVTRAEFLKMFLFLSPSKYSVLQWSIGPNQLWADTPADAWYARYMAFANAHGLFADFNYCGYGRICPDAAITRGEVAQLMYNYKRNMGIDVGFPKPGLLTRIYAAATSSGFYLPNLPSNASGAFKVPSRVFNLNEAAAALRNVDCSQPTTGYYDAVSGVKEGNDDPWIYFYTPASNWKDSSQKEDFYFTNFGQEQGVFGPFNDSLGKLLDDMIAARCIYGTFGSTNYTGIPTNPNNNPGPTPTPTPTPTVTSPVLTGPANGSSYYDANPSITFTWNPVAGAARYDFMIKLGGSSQYTIYSTNNNYYYLPASAFPPLVQNYGQSWKVRAVDANGNYAVSSEWAFTIYKTQSNLSTPVLTNPANGTTYDTSQSSVTVNFKWTPSNASYYHFKMRLGTSNSYFVDQVVNTNTYSYGFSGILNNPNYNGLNYYWTVVAYDSYGNSIPANGEFYFGFKAAAPVLGTPVLRNPADNYGVYGNTCDNINLTFDWYAASNAVKYVWYMNNYSSPSNYTLSSLNWTMNPDNFPNGTYSWYVRAYDANGNYKDSAKRTLYISQQQCGIY